MRFRDGTLVKRIVIEPDPLTASPNKPTDTDAAPWFSRATPETGVPRGIVRLVRMTIEPDPLTSVPVKPVKYTTTIIDYTDGDGIASDVTLPPAEDSLYDVLASANMSVSAVVYITQGTAEQDIIGMFANQLIDASSYIYFVADSEEEQFSAYQGELIGPIPPSQGLG